MLDEFLPSATLPNIAWGAGGALGTAALSKLLLPNATGAMGFLRDAASVLGIGWVARQVGGREAQTAAIIGGGTILAVKLLNSLGVGQGFGLSEMAADSYSDMGLGAYYRESSLDVPWQGGTVADLGAYYEDPSLGAYYEDPSLGAYYEDPSLGAIEDYDEPGLFDLGSDDDDMMEDYDTDSLGDDDDMMEDYDTDSLGDNESEFEGEDEMEMF